MALFDKLLKKSNNDPHTAAAPVPQQRIMVSVTDLEGNSIYTLSRGGHTFFTGTCLARRDPYILADGFSDNIKSLCLFTRDTLIAQKRFDGTPRGYTILPSGCAYIFTDIETVVILSRDNSLVRTFGYNTARPDARVLSEELCAFAVVKDETVSVRAFILATLETWRKKIPWEPSQGEPALSLSDGILRLKFDDDTVLLFDQRGNQLPVLKEAPVEILPQAPASMPELVIPAEPETPSIPEPATPVTQEPVAEMAAAEESQESPTLIAEDDGEVIQEAPVADTYESAEIPAILPEAEESTPDSLPEPIAEAMKELPAEKPQEIIPEITHAPVEVPPAEEIKPEEAPILAESVPEIPEETPAADIQEETEAPGSQESIDPPGEETEETKEAPVITEPVTEILEEIPAADILEESSVEPDTVEEPTPIPASMEEVLEEIPAETPVEVQPEPAEQLPGEPIAEPEEEEGSVDLLVPGDIPQEDSQTIPIDPAEALDEPPATDIPAPAEEADPVSIQDSPAEKIPEESISAPVAEPVQEAVEAPIAEEIPEPQDAPAVMESAEQDALPLEDPVSVTEAVPETVAAERSADLTEPPTASQEEPVSDGRQNMPVISEEMVESADAALPAIRADLPSQDAIAASLDAEFSAESIAVPSFPESPKEDILPPLCESALTVIDPKFSSGPDMDSAVQFPTLPAAAPAPQPAEEKPFSIGVLKSVNAPIADMNIGEFPRLDFGKAVGTPWCYCNYTGYIVEGKTASGKMARGRVFCKTEAEALAKARKQLLPPYSVSVHIPERPTARQMACLRRNGVTIPKGLNAEDAHFIISQIMEEQLNTPRPELAIYADTQNIRFSAFIGEDDLIRKILEETDDRERAAFYAYCVNQRAHVLPILNMNQDPVRIMCYVFADQAMQDPAMLAGIQNLTLASINHIDPKDPLCRKALKIIHGIL